MRKHNSPGILDFLFLTLICFLLSLCIGGIALAAAVHVNEARTATPQHHRVRQKAIEEGADTAYFNRLAQQSASEEWDDMTCFILLVND